MLSPRKLDYLVDYMDVFYGSLTEENRQIGDFLADSSVRGRMLDVGCGPSFFYWALFNPHASEMRGADFRADNIRFARSETVGVMTGNVAARYSDVARYMVERFKLNCSAEEYLRDRASKVKGLRRLDLSRVWPYAEGRFDQVNSCFGMDHLKSPEQFRKGLRKARNVLSENGRIVLVTLCETSSWICGGTRCECLYTTKESLTEDLEASDFHVRHLQVVSTDGSQGYDKMLFALAER